MSSTGKHSEAISGFTPLNFGGCRLWLDATSPSNFALSGSSNITTWYDKSPFSNHASNIFAGTPVLSNNVINGRSTVYLSNAPSLGGSLRLSNAGVTGFLVLRPLQLGIGRNSDQRIISCVLGSSNDFDSTSRFMLAVQQQTTEIRFFRGGVSIPRTNFNASNNYIISWTYDGSINSIYLNGANADLSQDNPLSNVAFNTDTYRLGSPANNTFDPFNGHIGEVIVYDDFLSPAYRQAVEGYLAWKWGIEPDLGITFSPLTSLPSCAVWFDGADPSTLTLSGSNITQWRDKAGSNVTSNIGTPVYVSNALGGVPGVRLDVNSGFKISPMSNAANTTTVSIYGVVAASNTLQNNARIFTVGRVADGQVNNDYNGAGNWTLFQTSVANPTLNFGHTDSYLYGSNNLSNGVPCLISAIFSGTAMTLWTNGSNRGSNSKSSTFTFDRMGIGKNTNPDAGTSYDAWAGSVGEFLIFYAAHTEAQRLQVESYLASKWNIPTRAPMNLVPTHSYAKTVPFLRDFLPTDIPGCALWMDAGDRSTLTLSSSNTVTGWTDKSGNRRPLTVNSAGTYSATGFNGLPTIQFVNGQWMTTSTAAVTSNSCSMFIVQQTGASTYLMPLSVGGTTNPYVFWWRGDFNSYTFNQEGAGGMGNHYYRTTGVPMIMTGIVTPNAGNYWAFYTNGTYLVNGDLGGFNTAPLSNTGGSNVYIPGNLVQFGGPGGGGFTGNISEVLIFSNALPNAQRQLVENYLATKWGLRRFMQGPEAHPFRYGPPVGVPPRSSPIGVSFWLDAADRSTFTLSGSNVTAWRDKSAGYVGSAVSNPVYTTVDGLPAVTFNGTNQYVNFGDVADLEIAPLNIFVVSKFNSTGPGAIFAKSAFGVAGRYSLLRENGNLGLLVEGSAAINYPTVADTNTSRRILAWTWDRTTNRLFQNGGSTPVISASFSDTTRLNTTFSFLVGAYNDGGTGGVPPSGLYFNGSINEILGIFGTLTTTQRQQIEGYLAEKWNLRTSLLPARHRYLSGAPGGFTPASISSCAIWLDAADATTLTLSGSNVTQWNDKSGNLNHFRTLDGTSPTYSSNQVVFPSGAVMRSVASISMSLNTYAVIVFKLATLSDFAYMLSFTNMSPGGYPGDYSIRASFGVISQQAFGGTGYIVNGTSNPSFGTSTYSNSPVIVAGKSTAGDMVGLTTVEISTASMGRFFVGSMYEVMLFSSPLTTTQRQQLEGYLAAKWGISASLPVDHPSRSGTPSILPTGVIPGASLWLDAADETTLTLTGSNVTQWRDKSGNGYHATGTGSTTRQAFNSLQGINIGPGNYFSFSNATAINTTSALTTFIVASAATMAGNFGRLLVFVGASGGGDAQSTSNVVAFQRGDGNQIGFERASLSRGSITYTPPFQFVGSAVFNPSTGIQYINGSSNASGGQTGGFNYFQYWIGRRADGGFEWSGSVCEVLAYNFDMPLDQRQQVEGYLAAKWGLSSTFPVGHPYLSGPQTGITPATAPGCMLWLDAADASSYTLSGSNLTAITDKSQYAWPLGTPTNFTVNSTKFNTTYPSFFATGTGQLGVNSNFILAQPLTVYFAGQATTANSSTFLFDGTTSDRVVIYQGATMFSGGSEFSPTNSGAATGSHVISAVYNGSSSSMRLNGITTTGTVGTSRFGGIRISGRNTGGDGYAGHICELVICAGAHTTAQRQEMEGYLAWKWGIPIRLPGASNNTATLYKTLASEFDPRSVGGCATWFDAADPTTIQFSSGSNVSGWLDKSGLQNHAGVIGSSNVAVYTANALNNRPVITFSSSTPTIFDSPYAPSSSNQPQTIFLVTRPSSIAGGPSVFSLSARPNGPVTSLTVDIPTWNSSNWIMGGRSGGLDGTTTTIAASTTRTDIVVGSWRPSMSYIAVNGTEYANSTAAPSTLVTRASGGRTAIGAGYESGSYARAYSGYFAEILVYSTLLTNADRQRIEGWLAWKWGLQSQLPALHPYSNVKF